MVVVFVSMFVVKVMKINFQLRSNGSPSKVECFTIENTLKTLFRLSTVLLECIVSYAKKFLSLRSSEPSLSRTY